MRSFRDAHNAGWLVYRMNRRKFLPCQAGIIRRAGNRWIFIVGAYTTTAARLREAHPVEEIDGMVIAIFNRLDAALKLCNPRRRSKGPIVPRKIWARIARYYPNSKANAVR